MDNSDGGGRLMWPAAYRILDGTDGWAGILPPRRPLMWVWT